MSEVEVLDSTVFDELLASLTQPVVVAALYRKFIGNAAAFIDDLRIQEQEARVETLHTLKGSAAMMGASRMAQLATHLQTQQQDGSVQVAQASEALAGELASFRSAATARLLAVGTVL